jgi:hypothetical protein
VRGPRRVVWVIDGSPAWDGAAVVGELDDVALPEVPEDEVVELDGVSMSLVAGGLVLVIVAVVVGVDDRGAVAENDGSTKLSGACSGSLNWRDTNVTAATRMPITARPSTLAATTAGVRLYQGAGDGGPDSSSPQSWSVTATDISRGVCAGAGSAELRDDLAGEELHVIEI